MFRFILTILFLVFIAVGCHGCSFINERLGITKKDPSNQATDKQYPEEEQERKVTPIPINPQHS